MKLKKLNPPSVEKIGVFIRLSELAPYLNARRAKIYEKTTIHGLFNRVRRRRLYIFSFFRKLKMLKENPDNPVDPVKKEKAFK